MYLYVNNFQLVNDGHVNEIISSYLNQLKDKGNCSIIVYRADKCKPVIGCVSISYNANAGGGLICEIGYSVDNEDYVFISIAVEKEILSLSSSQAVLPFCPNFIDYLKENASFLTPPAGLRHRLLNLAEVDDFLSVCADRSRAYPIVLVSNSKYTPELIVPEKLQRQLFGLAQVYYVETDIDSRELTNRVPYDIAAWYGYSRIIYPYDEQAGLCPFDLLTYSDLKNKAKTTKSINRYILSLLTEKMNPLKLRQHISVKDVKARIERDRLIEAEAALKTKLREQQQMSDAVSHKSYEQKIQDLQHRLNYFAQNAQQAAQSAEQANKEVERIKREKEQAEQRVQDERARLEELKQNLAAEGISDEQKKDYEWRIAELQRQNQDAVHMAAKATKQQEQAKRLAEQAKTEAEEAKSRLTQLEAETKNRQRVLMPEDCRIQLGDSVDGPAAGFGKRFWSAIKMRLAEKSEVFEKCFAELLKNTEITRIFYQDRYLRSPVHCTLLYEVLSALPCYAAYPEHLEIITTPSDEDGDKEPRSAFHNFPDAKMQQEVLRELFPKAKIELSEIREADHERQLIIEYKNGKIIDLGLDQGFGSWKSSRGSTAYDFGVVAQVQVLFIKRSSYSVAIRVNSGGKIVVSIRG